MKVINGGKVIVVMEASAASCTRKTKMLNPLWMLCMGEVCSRKTVNRGRLFFIDVKIYRVIVLCFLFGLLSWFFKLAELKEES